MHSNLPFPLIEAHGNLKQERFKFLDFLENLDSETKREIELNSDYKIIYPDGNNNQDGVFIK